MAGGRAGCSRACWSAPCCAGFADVLTVSQGIADELRAWWRPGGGGARIAVIPNSVSPPFAAVAADARAAGRAGYLVPGPASTRTRRACDTLLRAYALAAPRMPGVRLELAGAGTPEASAAGARLGRRAAACRCWSSRGHRARRRGRAAGGLAGQAGGADAAAASMRRCLFLAMPSRYEAWPITALEAAVCGRPVLGTDVIGVRDAAPASAHGLLVPPDDPARRSPRRWSRWRGDRAAPRGTGRAGARLGGRSSPGMRLAARQEQFYQEVLAATAPSPPASGGDRDTGPA